MSIKGIIVCIEFAFLAIQIVTAAVAYRHKNLLKGINILGFIAVWLCFIAIIVLNFAE